MKYITSKSAKCKQWILSVVNRIWFVKIKHKWNILWIRKGEFHKTLDIDANALMQMSDKEAEEYETNLIKRRNIAHRRDMD